MIKVAVLGCGPTGLVAAHAAALHGADVTIYSKHRKSNMFGAQYLHKPIPGVTPEKAVTIDYILKGTEKAYRAKVYGPDYKGETSPSEFEGRHQAWDIRAAYDGLWERYEHRVCGADITPGWLVGTLPSGFDHIINTIPMPQLCVKGHTFAGQDVWIMGDSDKQVVPVLVAANTVVCNGEDAPSWYRASNIFGYKTVEWPNHVNKPPLPVAKVTKPLFNNCTCWPNMVRLGRFGMWRKGLLVHHAYEMTADLMTGNFSAIETRPHLSPCPLANENLSTNVALQMGCRCA